MRAVNQQECQMAVEISPDLEKFVEQEVASGHFSD